jgi:hypothetical protein
LLTEFLTVIQKASAVILDALFADGGAQLARARECPAFRSMAHEARNRRLPGRTQQVDATRLWIVPMVRD